MLKLTANGTKKTINDEFFDVKLNDLAAAYKYVSGLDAETKRYLLTGGENVNSDKLFEFKLHWISLFSNFTIEELRLVSIGDEYELGSIDWLYSKCELFLHQPKSYVQLKEFKHKGKDYNLIEPIKTISGAELLFGNGNYRQFMIGSQLTAMIEQNKNQGGIPSLITLFALLYSDGNDSSEDVVQRTQAFGEVNALYGWSAYFFFVELVEKYKNYFHLSTTKNPPLTIAKEYLKQQLNRSLLKTSFGRLLRSKLPKREFSVLET
jgi:hypothetical protein